MRRSTRNALSFPDFSLRRLLLQGARAARGSPPLGQRLCDVEKGASKHDKSHASASGSGNSKSHGDATSSNVNASVTPPPPPKCSNLSSSEQRDSDGGAMAKMGATSEECLLCYNHTSRDDFYSLLTCNHTTCRGCLENYLIIEITESRTDIACPLCLEAMHPSDIQKLLKNHPSIMSKYEDFMVRRVLLADPDSRWCPAPDCGFAVIATGCASCPRIKCERPGCDVNFCYHCKAEWHPDQTCDAARASRHSPTRAPSGSISQDSQHRDDIKPCPRCQVLIVKMDDGSCNHMVCAVCGSEFCWLCMKLITDLHYLSPSGCTFWGKKPWSRKKKLLWQLGTLVGAPVGIALVAGIAVPAMIIGIPVWVGRKIHARYKVAGKHKRNCAVLGAVAASVLVAPVLAGLAVAIGVPILLFYVYGVVPVSLCRAGCGVSTTKDGFKFDFEEEYGATRNPDAASVDAVSRIGATSIGEVSLSVASGSHLGVSGQNPSIGVVSSSTRESTTALAGSITGHRLEVQADVSTSETASAVTCVSEKSGNTLNDTASTRALAGSILSSRQHIDSANVSEDGISERVRFDSTICYVIDGKKESDAWYTVPLDQDLGADKLSVDSGRSMRSSERSFRDELDSSSLSSGHKRMTFSQRKLTNSQHRNLSVDSNTGSNNYIPENVSLEVEEEEETNRADEPTISVTFENGVVDDGASSSKGKGHDVGSAKQDKSNAKRSATKTAILRNLFFFQNENGGPKS
ncbi:E3 ubiquitin-protein ligase RNF19B-like [Lutzomyia longipalpis]|uniref:E3 ubiquitin-protein ligase RNF19B-like n=1 Tax=Lutzomyia longipalpis TaxID=7200 RepID=UPI0024837A35|nr:E3 ubiquitin-protein ligase RNF19B-like [Lutzomyia longipalpis]XP_055692552.1 E3 ubiquitin-protein ligase RNF19B-like [Lutzomyia longipalpis]XP_055692559.1 E3 ubiquitin-protein ligase RNF19B-like [Lutzomyia longipalpis]XP_055692568.1 E3 ubiquitin-protein ligase RNF19B-like [Lutzomyia longipalpis]